MGELIRQYDWATSVLGTPDQWPPSLLTTLGIMLHTPVPLFLWWGSDLIQFYNDACRSDLEPMGKHPTALGQRGAACWPESWSVIKPLIDKVLAGSELTGGQIERLPMPPNGRAGNGYRMFSYSPVWGENGLVAGVLAVGHETTQPAPPAQPDQERFQFVAPSAQFGVWEFDLTTGLVHWDDRFDELFGPWPSRSEPYEQAQRSIHPDDVNRVTQARQLALTPQSGGHYDIIHRLIGKADGPPRWGRFTGQAYFNADGAPYLFTGIAQNVTAEVEARQQTEASAAYLKRVFRHTAVGVYITYGTDSVIEMVNPAMCAFWNLIEEQLVGKSISDILPEIHRLPYEDAVADIRQTGQPYVGRELTNTINRHGQWHTTYFDVVAEPLFDADGRVNRIIHTVIEVTERVLARQLTEQLLVRERELNELKSNFVTLASHEFRTPMTTILSSASLVGRYNGEGDGDKRKRHVQRIESAVDGLTHLLDDFLSISQTEQPTLQVHPYPLHVGLFCQEIIADIRGVLKPGQCVAYRHLDGESDLLLDGQLLRNILINLLVNAGKYSAEGQEIGLTTSVQADQLWVTVKDEGIGIPDAEKDKLFVNFFRASNVTHIQGTGLGLYIVKRYVDLLGGQITFTSQLDSGTIFTVQLPLFTLSLTA